MGTGFYAGKQPSGYGLLLLLLLYLDIGRFPTV